MPTVILLAGRPRHGKDTHAIYLRNELANLHYSNEIMSFAAPGKAILKDMGLITMKPELKEVERPIMRRFMNEVCKKHMGQAVWVNGIINKIEESDSNYILIPDWRFPIETKQIKATYDKVFTYYVTRPDIEQQDQAPEENALKSFDADRHLINTDIDSIKKNVKVMLEDILNAE